MSILAQDTIVISSKTVQRIDAEIEEIKNNTDVADVVADKAELDAYDTSRLTDNAIIKVLQDESENDASTYYRYVKSSDTFELIGSVGPYYTKAESDDIEAQVRSDFADADQVLQENIDTEASARQSADSTLQNNIDAEEQARINADDTLQGNIETVANDLSTEVTRATGIEGQLRTDLTAETTRATTAEGTLTTNLNTEIINRQIADSDLSDRIDIETSDRESQDDFINGRIDGVINDLGLVTGELETHVGNTSNPHSVTKAQVGLGNVDNTSDLNKPISTATQNALDSKLDKSNSASKVYGTDSTGAQITYNVDSFGQVDDVQVNGTSVVSNKIANIDLTTKSGITLRVWGGNE